MKRILFVWLAAFSLATAEPGQTLGPEKGTLMVVGGGGGSEGQKLYQKFFDLAGGKEARIVVITTAASSSKDHDYSASSFARVAEGRVKQVTVLHTHDPQEADTDAFAQPIEEATGVWFSGGRQWRLVDAYGGTRSEKAFRGVLERGGIIGGSSAGATIQGSFLARGDTKGNRLMIGDHQFGFGYITHAAIDQHVLSRKREDHMYEILNDPEGTMDGSIDREALMGFGVAENSAMLVRGNTFEVIGKPEARVLVYNPRAWKKKKPHYLTLKRGQFYDMKARRVVKPD